MGACGLFVGACGSRERPRGAQFWHHPAWAERAESTSCALEPPAAFSLSRLAMRSLSCPISSACSRIIAINSLFPLITVPSWSSLRYISPRPVISHSPLNWGYVYRIFSIFAEFMPFDFPNLILPMAPTDKPAATVIWLSLMPASAMKASSLAIKFSPI